jgi:AcrR family transcriptional regulator
VCYNNSVPITLDRDARRAELARAVWRIVLRDGAAAASVRGVAREAGLSMGSVRYIFSTQSELLRFAMREVIDTARLRIRADADRRAAMVQRGAGVDAARALLEQVLPMDDERLVEARVWAAFGALTVNDPELAAIRHEADSAVRELCHDCLRDLRRLGQLHRSRHLGVETERLWALLDGLTMHILLDATSARTKLTTTVLRAHLYDLATKRPGPEPLATRGSDAKGSRS